MDILEEKDAIELKDIDLEKVNGGSFDWKEFGINFMNALRNETSVITAEHKRLVAVIKEKNYIEVSCIAISLLSKDDPLVKKAIIECIKK